MHALMCPINAFELLGGETKFACDSLVIVFVCVVLMVLQYAPPRCVRLPIGFWKFDVRLACTNLCVFVLCCVFILLIVVDRRTVILLC